MQIKKRSSWKRMPQRILKHTHFHSMFNHKFLGENIAFGFCEKSVDIGQKRVPESFCDKRGVILVNLEPQLERMMFQWNEKLLSPPRHLSTEPNPRFPLSCAHQPPPKYPCRSEDRFKNSLSSLNLGLCPHHHQVAPSYHIITDLSAGVFGEVMHKLPSTLVQHDSLHSHYSTSCTSIVKTLTLSKYV